MTTGARRRVPDGGAFSEHSGPRRWLGRALAVAGGMLIAGVIGPGAPASADEPTPEPAVPSTSTTVPPGPVTVDVAPDWADGDPPPNPCDPAAAPELEPATESIVPDDCWGRFPSSHYDIGFDEGAWNHLSRKVYGTFTDLAFQGSRTATSVGLWLVGWAYGFGIVERLGDPAIQIGAAYQRDIIGPLGLGDLAWFYAVAWAAVAALRGRLTLAAGELAISILAAGLAALLLANPAGYVTGAFDTTTRLSGALLAAGTGQPPPADPTAAAAVLEPLQGQLHAAFVEQPYDILNWGAPLTGTCAVARDRILAAGPHGADDAPRTVMSLAGCTEQADFNHDPNASRLFGAVLTFAAAGVLVVLLALVAMTIVVAQVIALVLFAIAPLALLAAVLPGAGRELAWRWMAALARSILAVVGMSFVLSLLLLTVSALLQTTATVGLVERFALLDVAVLAMFVARKRILAAGHNLATTVGQRLATRRPGGERSAPWTAGPAVAGVSGFALGAAVGPDRSSRSSRLAAAAGRNALANRRVTRSQHAAEARADRRTNAVTTRQRTEVGVDGDGNPTTRTSLTVDGPAPTTRRARATRDRVEAHARTHARTNHERRDHGWQAVPDGDVAAPADDTAVDDAAVDAEEV